MDAKTVLPAVVLAASITAEAVLPMRHDDVVPQPHIEVTIPQPLATTVLMVSASGGPGGEPTGFEIRQIR
jgi:hypothetical protein